MWIAFWILSYLIAGVLVYILLVKLEKAKIVTMFNIKDGENAMAVTTELFWPILLIALLLALPAKWSKQYLK